jgi:NitT/TauT family transport system substrate-binding protein
MLIVASIVSCDKFSRTPSMALKPKSSLWKRKWDMQIRLWAVMSLAFVALSTIVACSATPTPTSAPTLFRVSWNSWPGTYPVLIGQESGIFARHGLHIEPVFVGDNYSTIVSDFAARKLDGTSLVLGDLLPLAAEQEIRAILATDSSDGADAVIATSDIRSPRDLRGASVGTSFGTFSELFVRQMLQKNDLTTDEVHLVNVSGESILDNMPDKIKAGHTWEPFTSQGVAKGYHVIFTSAETPGLITNVIAFHADTVQQQPQAMRAFVAAWFETLAWWQAHPAEGNAMVAQAAGMKPSDISTDGDKFLTRDDNLVAFAHGNDTRSLYYTANLYLDFFVNAGVLIKRPDIEKLFDSDFLK